MSRPITTIWGCAAATAFILQSCAPDLAEIRPDDHGIRILHPYAQPRPGRSIQRVSLDGSTTYVDVAPSLFEKSNPFDVPPGSHFINNVASNMYDGRGREMPNTLPSTQAHPDNLHDGELQVLRIDPRSPTSDLRQILRRADEAARQGRIDTESLQEAIDIIEGNPVFPGRTYNGFPILHYNGPNKVKRVEPIHDANGELVGGNVDIHQIWFDAHIESDTSFIDASAVFDVPWTISYTIDVLERGADDFAPFVMYADDPYLSSPGSPPRPHIGMDQTFFPMLSGNRYVVKIKMTLGKYFNLTYHWGWRIHPPRIQVAENALKTINGRTLPAWERRVFGDDPTANRDTQLDAIAKIGELSPAKRMWAAFRRAIESVTPEDVVKALDAAGTAFQDWQDRTRLPQGVDVDADADLTLFYVNNTIYGEMLGGGTFRLEK